MCWPAEGMGSSGGRRVMTVELACLVLLLVLFVLPVVLGVGFLVFGGVGRWLEERRRVRFEAECARLDLLAEEVDSSSSSGRGGT